MMSHLQQVMLCCQVLQHKMILDAETLRLCYYNDKIRKLNKGKLVAMAEENK